MDSRPKFQLWPLLDKEINRGIGRAGIVFTALFCLLSCGIGYYFIRPWSVLHEADLRQLGYLGFVAIPLAAWLLGGLFAIQLFMAFQSLRWAFRREIMVSRGTWIWLFCGVLLALGGVWAGISVEPFEYGFLVSITGLLIFLRTTGALWASKVIFEATAFPPRSSLHHHGK